MGLIERKVYFLGDVHCEFDWLINEIVNSKIVNADIFQVGDFGVGFLKNETDLLKSLNDVCISNNVTIYVIRGNHDNPSYFNRSYTVYSKIIFVPDDTFFQVNGMTYFLSGGAISIDRKIRKSGVNYWENEGLMIDFAKVERELPKYSNIDIVITHNAPGFAFPTLYDRIVHRYIARDSQLKNELKVERAQLTKLYGLLLSKKIKYWFYGHFHTHHEEETSNGLKFILLNSNEFYKLTNFVGNP